MLRILNSIDMFGIAYNIKTLGRDKYTSPLGGCLTIVALIVITGISFLFGTDFYFKKNPRVREEDVVHETMQEMKIDEYNHPFMIRMGAPSGFDGKTIDYSNSQNPFKPMARYNDIKMNDKKKYDRVCNVPDAVINCSETALKGDLRFTNFDLTQWSCLDYAKIIKVCSEATGTKYEPYIGGVNGDEHRADIYLAYTNFEYGPNFEMKNISSSEALRQVYQIVVEVIFPKFHFNSGKATDALTTKVEKQMFAMAPTSMRFEYKYLKKVRLDDDFGWLTEEIDSTYSLDLDATTTNYDSNDLSKEGLKFFYSCYFFLNRNEKVFNRVFMRLQDVAAQISSFVKAFLSCVVLLYYAIIVHRRYQAIITDIFDIKEVSDLDKAAVSQPVVEGTIVDSVVGDSKVHVGAKKVGQLGFCSYFFGCGLESGVRRNSISFFKEARRFIDERLDVSAILHIYERIERLAELTLSDEEARELSLKRKRDTVIN